MNSCHPRFIRRRYDADTYAGTARRGRTARGTGAPKGLREQTYAVEVAADGDAEIFEAGTTDYDAIVLDVIPPRQASGACSRSDLWIDFRRSVLLSLARGVDGLLRAGRRRCPRETRIRIPQRRGTQEGSRLVTSC
jgi:hypothetical protein